MHTHTKTRVEVIVEAPLKEAVLERLEAEGARGYTVFRAEAGLGAGKRWQRGQLTRSGEMVSIVVIIDPERAEALMGAVNELIIEQGYDGIVFAGAVYVIRGERF
jgi:PII-like signaling protein